MKKYQCTVCNEIRAEDEMDEGNQICLSCQEAIQKEFRKRTKEFVGGHIHFKVTGIKHENK